MVIYNVTTKLHFSIAAAWLQWLKEEHIPAIIATGCFTDATILQLLDTDDTEGPTYAVQYHSPDKKKYEEYIASHAAAMRQEAINKWGDQFISFRSVLAVVH